MRPKAYLRYFGEWVEGARVEKYSLTAVLARVLLEPSVFDGDYLPPLIPSPASSDALPLPSETSHPSLLDASFNA
jgi:hypothetical protein